MEVLRAEGRRGPHTIQTSGLNLKYAKTSYINQNKTQESL
jgi:hypothetical protein